MTDQFIISLDSLAGGELLERFEYALARVAENIRDERCDAEAKREIRVKIVFEPTETRAMAVVTAGCETKLVAPTAAKTQVLLGERGGSVFVSEYNAEQLDIPGLDADLSAASRRKPRGPVN